MKAKKVYLPDKLIQDIQHKIDVTDQSFSDYVRNALISHHEKPITLPHESIIEHSQQISILSNMIHNYILFIAEKDLYADCLTDLITIQQQLQQLIETETQLVNYIIHSKGSRTYGYGKFYSI